MQHSIFTLGYEGIPADGFIALLLENGIQRVIDVREVPLSRKPGFSKSALRTRLEEAGIAYTHMVALGCPKLVRDGYRQDQDWARYKRGFLRHLKQQADAVRDLAGLATASPSCLICYEADYRMCHRSMVADAAATASGLAVSHLSRRTDRAVARQAA